MSVDRINILNSPTGEISTIDKFQFLFGMYPDSDIPPSPKVSKSFNKFRKTLEFYKTELEEDELKKVQLFNNFKYRIK